MELHRLVADAEPRGYRFVRQTFADELQHLDLARSQWLLKRRAGVRTVGDDQGIGVQLRPPCLENPTKLADDLNRGAELSAQFRALGCRAHQDHPHMSASRTLADRQLEFERRAPSTDLDGDGAPDAVRPEQGEQVSRRDDAMSAEAHEHVPDHDAGLGRWTSRRDGDDEQRVWLAVRTPLRLGELHRLPCHAEITAPGAAVLHDGRHGL